jgi:hypothetical protein
MKEKVLVLLICCFVSRSGYSQNIPEGYLLQYQQNFSGSTKALEDFKIARPETWGIFKNSNNFYLQCTGAENVLLIPSNIAVLSNKVFGDFILEIDVTPGADSNGLSEVCLFLGMRDLNRYYYVQLANRSDSSTHGIFLVKDSIKSRLTDASVQSVDWMDKKWHKIRIERNIVKRTIRVFIDEMTHPLMETKDYELVMGSVGIGSFVSPARFDNIKIWAPTVISE